MIVTLPITYPIEMKKALYYYKEEIAQKRESMKAKQTHSCSPLMPGCKPVIIIC